MNDKREQQLSAIIDDDKGFEFFKSPQWDPELAAMADTVQLLRSAREFEQPSPGFAERGWRNIAEQVKPAAPAAAGRRTSRRRTAWITAAASLLVVAALLANPWWRTPPTAGASEIRVAGSVTAADLGVQAALFPRYAGSLDRLSYGTDDKVMLWDRGTGQHREFPLRFPYMRDAAWSPDGKLVAFAGYPSTKDGPGSPGIWIAGSDGSAPRLAVKPSDPETAFESPAWSPDGKRIAFTSTRASLSDTTGVIYEHSVMMVEADGSNLSKVADGGQPAWSRDGKSLGYTVFASTGMPEIWVSDSQGNHARKLAEGQSPAWSPNHPFIAFSKNRTEHRNLAKDAEGKETYAADVTYRELWAVNVESGTEVRLTESAYPQEQIDALLGESKGRGETQAVYTVSGVTADEYPAWSPDGTRIVFTRSMHEEQGPHFQLQELFIDYR